MAKPVTFLSDYGYADEFAGVCRAVIARIAPDAAVIDLTHGIPRLDVAAGSAVLADAVPFTPPGIHLAVVDPGVGSTRKAVVIRAANEERMLVGPDNGLLTAAADRLGGAVEAFDVSFSPVRLEPVSATFHGRDIFAPVAAHLALGSEPAELGEPVDPAGLVVLPRSEPVIDPGRQARTTVQAVDRFGNAELDLDADLVLDTGLKLGRRLMVEATGESHDAVYAATFADAAEGDLLVYLDANRHVALAVNRGNAAELLGLAPGDAVILRPH